MASNFLRRLQFECMSSPRTQWTRCLNTCHHLVTEWTESTREAKDIQERLKADIAKIEDITSAITELPRTGNHNIATTSGFQIKPKLIMTMQFSKSTCQLQRKNWRYPKTLYGEILAMNVLCVLYYLHVQNHDVLDRNVGLTRK